MIPLVIPSLSNLRVLVTRPAHQAQSLCDAIAQLGGEVVPCPLLEIKPREAVLAKHNYDLVVFVSANAVLHGATLLQSLNPAPRLAVIGEATAAALKATGADADLVAPPPFNSESLLQVEPLQAPPKNILVVRGAGGRDLLRETLTARGSEVDVAEVYERAPLLSDERTRTRLQELLRDDAVDVITVTSVEIADALFSLLAGMDHDGWYGLALIAGSRRIASHLSDKHWPGGVVISDSPDDATMLRTLTRWHTRARST